MQQIIEARDAVEIAVDNRAAQAARKHLFQLRRAERVAFETARGWRFSERHFGVEQLKAGKWVRAPYEPHWPEVDHTEVFVDASIKRAPPLAIRAHSYAPWERCLAFAERHGLRAELLPWSSYLPNQTIAVVYTRPE